MMNAATFRPARRHSGAAPTGRRQKGIVLFIALIILVAMSLSGIALIRQTTADVVVAGNLAFKESATYATDRALSAAEKWLSSQANGVVLQNDNLPLGYYSSWAFNLNTQAWDDAHSVLVGGLTDDGYGNEIRYVIHRLCPDAGFSLDGQTTSACTTLSTLDNATGNTQGGPSYGGTPPQGASRPYYRVTVRVVGPRHSLSYAQAIIR